MVYGVECFGKVNKCSDIVVSFILKVLDIVREFYHSHCWGIEFSEKTSEQNWIILAPIL